MRLLPAAVITVLLSLANATAAPAHDVQPNLQKAADCMYQILKQEPGFDNTKLDVYESDGYSLPYLQYLSPADKLGRRIIVTFRAEVDCTAANRAFNCCADKHRFCFLAVLGGIFAPPEPGPPDGGVNVIARKWNVQCDVVALAISV